VTAMPVQVTERYERRPDAIPTVYNYQCAECLIIRPFFGPPSGVPTCRRVWRHRRTRRFAVPMALWSFAYS
jgi:hypothetical protein